MDELEKNREAFEIIKSIDCAANRIQNNIYTSTSISISTSGGSAARSQLVKFISSETIKQDYPESDSTTLLKSLLLLKLAVGLYAYNLLSTLFSTIFNFKSSLTPFPLLYALFLFIIASILSFFSCHFPLMSAASRIPTSLLQKGTSCLSLSGLALQSIFWILLTFGIMTGASDGIFAVLSHLNFKEWPLFLVGSLNILFISTTLIFSFYLKQEIIRKYLLQ